MEIDYSADLTVVVGDFNEGKKIFKSDLKKLRQQAMIQALRTRKRYKAVVGDAKNSEDFEIKVLKPE